MVRLNKKDSKFSYISHSFENCISASVIRPLLPKYFKKGTILVYHNIAPDLDKSKIEADSVKKDEFERQVQFLKENDFNITPLQKLVSDLLNGLKIKEKTVVITFDDGYRTTFSNALPILKKYDFPATVFLAVDYIGKNISFPWLNLFGNPDASEDLSPMDWKEVKELYHAGIEIGSHTCSHTFLPKSDNDTIQKELTKSRNIIHEVLGEPPGAFALPFSFPIKHHAWPHFKSALIKGLEKGGYTSCCTLCRGYVDSKSNPYMLKRIFIDKYDSLQSFYSKLIGAYTWTRFPQFVFQKFFKNYDKLNTSLNNNAQKTIT